MKTINRSPNGQTMKRLAAGLVIALGGLMATGNAMATSAGTTLRNEVTVDYTDAGGKSQPTETDSVDVTVDHVADVAWGAAPAGQTTNSGSALPSAYVIDLTNTGNGSDSYNITNNTTETCGGGTLTAETFFIDTPQTLGATVSASAGTLVGGDTEIEVSNLTAADFANGDTVVIGNGGTEYTVVSATEGATLTDNDVLVVAGDQTADFNAAGLQIGERLSFEYGDTGTAGTISGAATCTHDHELVVDGTTADGGNAQSSDTVNGWATTVNGVTLTVDKYVRNVTTAAKNPGTADITFDGESYFETGVTGNPGETLEYLIVIDNATAGDAAGVEFNDTLPAFTTYETSSAAVDTDSDGAFDVNLPGDETEADNEAGGIVTQSGSSIQVFAGTGGDENTDTGGNINAGEQSVVKYQITID